MAALVGFSGPFITLDTWHFEPAMGAWQFCLLTASSLTQQVQLLM